MNHTIGIDFGTTKTLVSYCDAATGLPRPIRLGRGTDYLPTTIYALEGGRFLFGDAADDEQELGASRYCRGFKMELGSDYPVLGFDEGGEFREYTARALSAEFLRHIRQECERRVFLGQPVRSAVITCPVSFSHAQRLDLHKAAEQAGFREVELLTEPEAAGLAFCHLCPEGVFSGEALIVDWGGGTLDMALVSVNGRETAIHSNYTDGRTDMGGELFDERLWQHLVKYLKEQQQVDLEQEAPEVQGRILARLRREKEALSEQEKRRFRLPRSAGVLTAELSRNTFEKLIANDVDQAARMTRKLCESIRELSLKPELLLLVGGTSLIPCIAETFRKELGLPCSTWQYCREAVSLGAALKATAEPESPCAATPQRTATPLLEHAIRLTASQMASGCTKSFGLKGKWLSVRVPAGTKAGARLRLPASQTQGLGEVSLVVSQIPSAASAPVRTIPTMVDILQLLLVKMFSPATAPQAPQGPSGPLEHAIRLSANELAKGCTKHFGLKGKWLSIRVPAGTKAGARLRLPASQTQGLGEVMLVVKQAGSAPHRSR